MPARRSRQTQFRKALASHECLKPPLAHKKTKQHISFDLNFADFSPRFHSNSSLIKFITLKYIRGGLLLFRRGECERSKAPCDAFTHVRRSVFVN